MARTRPMHLPLLGITLALVATFLSGCSFSGESESSSNSTDSSEVCSIDTGGSCKVGECSAKRDAICVDGQCLCRAGACAVNGTCVHVQASCAADTGGTCKLAGCGDSRNATCVDGRCKCQSGFCADAGKCIAESEVERRTNRGNVLFKILDTEETGVVTNDQFAKVTGSDSVGITIFEELDKAGDTTVDQADLESFPGSLSALLGDIPGGTVSREDLLAAATLLEEEMAFAKLFEAVALLMDRIQLRKTADGQTAVSVAPLRLAVNGFGQLPMSMARLEIGNESYTVLDYLRFRENAYQISLQAHHNGNGSVAESKLLSCSKILLEMADLLGERTESLGMSTACVTFIRGVKLVRAWEAVHSAVTLDAEPRIMVLMLSNLDYKLKTMNVTDMPPEEEELLGKAKGKLVGYSSEYATRSGCCVARKDTGCLAGIWTVLGTWKNSRFDGQDPAVGSVFEVTAGATFGLKMPLTGQEIASAELTPQAQGEREWISGDLKNSTSTVAKVSLVYGSKEGIVLVRYVWDGEAEDVIYVCFKTLKALDAKEHAGLSGLSGLSDNASVANLSNASDAATSGKAGADGEKRAKGGKVANSGAESGGALDSDSDANGQGAVPIDVPVGEVKIDKVTKIEVVPGRPPPFAPSLIQVNSEGHSTKEKLLSSSDAVIDAGSAIRGAEGLAQSASSSSSLSSVVVKEGRAVGARTVENRHEGTFILVITIVMLMIFAVAMLFNSSMIQLRKSSAETCLQPSTAALAPYLLLLFCAHGLCSSIAQSFGGVYPWDPFLLASLVEVLKAFASSILLLVVLATKRDTSGANPEIGVVGTWLGQLPSFALCSECALHLLPVAILYVGSACAQVFIVDSFQPSSFLAWRSTLVVFTSLFWMVQFRIELPVYKTFGVVIFLASCGVVSMRSGFSEGQVQSSWAPVVLSALMSSAAAVANEGLLKTPRYQGNLDINHINLMLYMETTLLFLVFLSIRSFMVGASASASFLSVDSSAMTIILLQAVLGLVVSRVLAHADSLSQAMAGGAPEVATIIFVLLFANARHDWISISVASWAAVALVVYFASVAAFDANPAKERFVKRAVGIRL